MLSIEGEQRKSERRIKKERQTSQHGYKQIVAAHKQSDQIYTMTAQLFQFQLPTQTHTYSLNQTAFSAVRLQVVQHCNKIVELVSKMANNKITRQMYVDDTSQTQTDIQIQYLATRVSMTISAAVPHFGN